VSATASLPECFDFFVAQVGASAVMAGLVFVGVSANLGRVMAMPALPCRALEAMLAVAAVLNAAWLFLVGRVFVPTIVVGQAAMLWLVAAGALVIARRGSGGIYFSVPAGVLSHSRPSARHGLLVEIHRWHRKCRARNVATGRYF
jgi:hypothetical protein